MDSTSQEHRTDANVIRVNPMKEAYEKKISLLERQLAASLNAQKKLEENCQSQEREMIEMEKTFNILKQRYYSQKEIAKKNEDRLTAELKESRANYDKLVAYTTEKLALAQKEVENSQTEFSNKEVGYSMKISQLALKNERLERELNLQQSQIAEMERIYVESLPLQQNKENIFSNK